jgi:hypothetical protein
MRGRKKVALFVLGFLGLSIAPIVVATANHACVSYSVTSPAGGPSGNPCAPIWPFNGGLLTLSPCVPLTVGTATPEACVGVSLHKP